MTSFQYPGYCSGGGFSERSAQSVTKGSAPTSSLNYDLNTNRLVGSAFSYDANGNLTKTPGPGGSLDLSYDQYHRLIQADGGSSGVDDYDYSPDGRRIWKQTDTGASEEEVYFYGVGGEKLGVYRPNITQIPGDYEIRFTRLRQRLYFAGKLVRMGAGSGEGGAAIILDRLGSVRKRGTTALDYHPYGEEKPTTTSQNHDKFATYYRDELTNLDYAHHRYYSNTLGRFLTPDPYVASGGPADPQSWNRYAYVQGDPVNFNDPAGLFLALPQPSPEDPVCRLWGAFYVVSAPWALGSFAYQRSMYFSTGDDPSGRGGGGAVLNSPMIDWGTTTKQRGRLKALLNGLAGKGRCLEKLFGAGANALGSFDKFLGNVSQMNFFNVTKMPFKALTQDFIVGNTVSRTLSASGRGGIVAMVLTDQHGNTTENVLLGPDYFNDPAINQPYVLFHEALHFFLNVDDPALERRLTPLGFKNTEVGSHDITEWLEAGCPD